MISNTQRPHEALGLATPLSRGSPGARPFDETLPPIVYAPDEAVRTVDANGRIGWHGRGWRISHALAGQPIGLRPTPVDGVVEVRFGQQVVRTLAQRAEPACGE